MRRHPTWPSVHIKLWQIILSALTTGGFISIAFGSGKVGAMIGAVLSTSLLC